MDMNDFKYQAMIDRTLIGNKYMQYVASIKEPDFTSEICVEIPSFCDPELLSTIESFRKNAFNPDRVHFAVCFQDDNMDVLEKLKSVPNCKIKHFKSTEAPGLCAARYECNKLVEQETYVMHTDSHMRAAKYWDVALIDMWKSCEDEKAIISGYPMNYIDYTDREPNDMIFTEGVKDKASLVTVVAEFDTDGKIRFHGHNSDKEPCNNRGLFISGGFLFARTVIDKDCPSDPDMFFVSDEITMDIRYWSYGYNVYHPSYMIMWHLYGYRKTKDNKPVKRFNTDNAVVYNKKRKTEELRTRSMLKLIKNSVDLHIFRLGKERSLDSFLEASGIDFEHHAVRGFAICGHFFTKSEDLSEEDMKWHYYSPSDTNEEERKHICNSLELSCEGNHDHETICVQIPSYKDPQIVHTVESLLYQADHPERVHIVICLQDDNSDVITSLASIKQVRFKQFAPAKAKGTGTARRACQYMYDNEDYILITDSHMLAIKHWDTMLIRQLLNTHDKKAVISGQAPEFGVCHNKAFWCGCFDMPYHMYAFGINCFTESSGEVPSFLYNNHYVDYLKDKWKKSEDFDVYVNSFGITGGYTFTFGIFNKQVPYSTDAVYRGDECITSVVAFTKGFNVYTYINGYLLHDAVTKRASLCLPPEKYQMEQQVMYDLVTKGIAGGVSLGRERTIDDLTDYLGVDFKNRKIYKRAYTCEPGTSDVNIESIGSRLYYEDAFDRLYCKNIHVIVAFSEQTAWEECVSFDDQYEEFCDSILCTAVRKNRVHIHPLYLTDGETYGSHVNRIIDSIDADDTDILLFVDGAVRFLAKWDDILIKTFGGLNASTVWSTNTYANHVTAPYNNPVLEIKYNVLKPEVAVVIDSERKDFHNRKPVMCRGVVAMRFSDYKKVPFDPNICYDDHADTYSLRLYTHGYDIYYDDMSHMYRNHIIYHLDGIETFDHYIKNCLLGSLYEDFDKEWLNYDYGHGSVRSVLGWYRRLGFIDTNRKSAGTAKF